MPTLNNGFARSADGASSAAGNSSNGMTQPLDVVCAWPVSSQYGIGSRFLYYVIVATCVFLRKAEWLRKACLAAALLVPSIAAFHGIVAAALHVNGAVDLDIFGAWQLCSVAIIAVPTTLRISGTYFNSAGRNLIFLWTVLLLSGLIALCVEFSRVTATDCSQTDTGQPLTLKNFPYGETTCNLVCSEDEGPFSPMRGGSAMNIYVIPVPSALSFNAAMLIAAGVCIPAILSLIFTLDKILQSSYWTRRKTMPNSEAPPSDAIKLTAGEIRGINNTVARFLSVIEIPLFGGLVLAITIAGEINFFSPQMMYMTEPMASIGQWSPIAGTCLAALGSLYVYVTEGDGFVSYSEKNNPLKPGSSRSDTSDSLSRARDVSMDEPCSPTHDIHQPDMIHRASNDGSALQPVVTVTGTDDAQNSTLHIEDVNHSPDTQAPSPPPLAKSTAGRFRVRNWLDKASIYMSETAHRELDTQGHKNHKAYKYPMFPGEDKVNEQFFTTSEQFTELRIKRVQSSASSIRSSNGDGQAGPSTPPAAGLARARSNTGPDAITPVPRRATLEVPEDAHRSPKLGSHQGWT